MVNEYVEILTRHVAENPPNYGSDANSILEMLFTYYHRLSSIPDENAVSLYDAPARTFATSSYFSSILG